MQQCNARIRCWDAFGAQNFHVVLTVNAPEPIPRLFFWLSRLLMICAPWAFNRLCTALYSRGVIRLRTQHEVEALFAAREVKGASA